MKKFAVDSSTSAKRAFSGFAKPATYISFSEEHLSGLSFREASELIYPNIVSTRKMVKYRFRDRLNTKKGWVTEYKNTLRKLIRSQEMINTSQNDSSYISTQWLARLINKSKDHVRHVFLVKRMGTSTKHYLEVLNDHKYMYDCCIGINISIP